MNKTGLILLLLIMGILLWLNSTDRLVGAGSVSDVFLRPAVAGSMPVAAFITALIVFLVFVQFAPAPVAMGAGALIIIAGVLFNEQKHPGHGIIEEIRVIGTGGGI